MITPPAQKSTRGRPSTGQTPVVGFPATDEFRAAIVKWAEEQPDRPELSEAARRLVEIGLKAGTLAKPAKTVATRARELADKTIEGIGDPGAAPEERAERSRRLTKGPSEFRDARVDLPKRKT